MDKGQMQKERARLQAVSDAYDAGVPHPGLEQRIAILDRKIAEATTAER